MAPSLTVFPPRTKAAVRPLAPKNVADDVTLLSRSSGRRILGWYKRFSILLFCFLPPVLSLITLLAEGGAASVVFAQCALSLSVLGSFILLADRPLVNPIQIVVFLFHWWFGIGPAVCSAFFAFTGQEIAFYTYMNDAAVTPILIVATGLPVYAAVARFITQSWPAWLYLRFLRPDTALYRPRTLFIFWGIATAIELITLVLARLGVSAFEVVNYMGGTSNVSPALAALIAVEQLGDFATIGVLAYIAIPRQKINRTLKIIAAAAILEHSIAGLFSGWKTPIIEMVFYTVVLLFTWRQKLPWARIGLAALLYMLIVEPYVSGARLAAERSGVVTAEQRSEVFETYLKDTPFVPDSWRRFNIESPFRLIFPFTVEISNRSAFVSGPWGGESVIDGLEVLVPRSIMPDKPNLNFGAYFAHQLGASSWSNSLYNIAITIPFEFVGNYGYIAGVASFALVAAFWCSLTLFLLSPTRLATHPLMPFCIGLALHIEGSVGHFLAYLRDLPLAFLVAYVVWLICGRRI